MNISNIITNEDILKMYIELLNQRIALSCTLSELCIYARSICDGLPSDTDVSSNFTNDKCHNDKGLYGKICEYALFNQKPNSNSHSDLKELEIDIKTCGMKLLKNSNYNAKERQTLTNVGTTANYESFNNICENDNFKDCKYFKKSKRFILIVRKDDKQEKKTFNQVMLQTTLSIVLFNFETLPTEMKDIIDNDYKKIQQSIIDNKVTQKQQEYLHIHPHGKGHGSGNRAFGFTSKFITRIIAIHLSEIHKTDINNILFYKGRSISIRKEFL